MKLDDPAPGVHIADADFVTLKRGACFGRCPVYSVTVRGDGRVSAMGERHVAHEGPLEWTIDRQVAHRLLGEFVRAHAFSREATMLVHVSDLPSARLEVQIGKRHVALEHRGGGAEVAMGFGGKDNPVLTRLEQLIDQISEAETRLVGCSTPE